jgi:3-oxoadipate enol-lactonase
LPYFTTPDNCKLYYTTDNFNADGPPVVFLNGTSQTTINWERHAVAFSKDFRVLRYDARAQGHSDIGTIEITAEVHIADLQDLLDHLNVQQTYLIGISHGAYIALRLAAATPRRVDRLVLCSIGNDSQGQVKQIINSWMEILQRSDLKNMARAALPLVFGKQYLKHHKEILDKIVTAISVRNTKEALIAHFSATSRYPSPQTFLKVLQCPTLVISGADDPIVDRKEARQLAADCRSRHIIFPHTGHSLPVEAPALFQRVVLDFLTRG